MGWLRPKTTTRLFHRHGSRSRPARTLADRREHACVARAHAHAILKAGGRSSPVPSDKFAGRARCQSCVRQCLLLIRKKNKSIAARASKVSDSPALLPKFMVSQPLRGGAGPVFKAIRGHFRPKRPPYLQLASDISDTPLSEMSDDLGGRYHEVKNGASAVSHHNNPAPLHVGTLTRKVMISRRRARSPSAPVRASYQRR
jgi:hypothetical protein